MIGYAICGSFCTHAQSLRALREIVARGEEVLPIMSEKAYSLDTKFGTASELCENVRNICKRDIIHSVVDAEPLGTSNPLDVLIVAPCTGNTLAKAANGISDGTVSMAIKAHLRSDRPLLIALASNDAMSQNLKNIGLMLTRRSVYFLPMRQDDPQKKPYSLVADLSALPDALSAVRRSEQLRPLFI